MLVDVLQFDVTVTLLGVRKYGKDFNAIAEVIGNKTENHIRSFFVNYKRRYNLDQVLKEFEKENCHELTPDMDEGLDTEVSISVGAWEMSR